MQVLGFLLAAAAAPPSPLAPLDFLAGSCFLGTFADGKTQDLVCYEPMLGGKFLRSRHRVIGGPSPYSGETILGVEEAKGTLEFTYFNSDGATMRGTIEPTADGYVAATEKREGQGWKPFMKIAFERKGSASGWTER